MEFGREYGLKAVEAYPMLVFDVVRRCLTGPPTGSITWSCGLTFGKRRGPCCLTGDLGGEVEVVMIESGEESWEK
jgi:hypothetical protein